jgi:two-component system, NtrC family, sensor histidine kinase KinB
MKTPIHSKSFIIGLVLYLVIILLLSILSSYYINILSGKTGAILKENHYSVVYAQDMSEALIIISQEINSCIITNKNPDTLTINKKLNSFIKSLQSEQNNITEIEEGKLVSDIKTGFFEYNDSLSEYMKSPKPFSNVLYLQMKFNILYQQLIHLSQINQKAIEEKTNDAKASAKRASIRMSFIGALCFLVAFAFTFSFASYFNERFYQFYDGLKRLGSSKYKERLYFIEKDEFYEMSLIINEMAEKLYEANQKKPLPLLVDSEKDIDIRDIQELKETLIQMKSIEKQAIELISKLKKREITNGLFERPPEP